MDGQTVQICTTTCERLKLVQRTTEDRERLTDDELALVYETSHCPDCNVGELLEGPSGGLSINRYCTNTDCGSRFNDDMFGWERISAARPSRKPVQ